MLPREHNLHAPERGTNPIPLGRALKAPSLRVLCATRCEHSIKCSFNGGLKLATEVETSLSPAYRGRVLGAFDKNLDNFMVNLF